MNWVELLQSRKNGKLSARQLLFIIWGIVLIVMWIAFSIKTGMICDIPAGIQVISGMILGSHVASNFVDNKYNSSSSPPPKVGGNQGV